MSDLAKALQQCIEVINRADTSAGVCGCGESMDNHSVASLAGHTPVDIGDYHAHQVVTDARAALAAQPQEPARTYWVVRRYGSLDLKGYNIYALPHQGATHGDHVANLGDGDAAQIAAEALCAAHNNSARRKLAASGTIKSTAVLPDGSGCATASFPLPKNHWLTAPVQGTYEAPPMPWRMADGEARKRVAEQIRAAGRYAVRSATMNGQDNDFDPDALLQNLVVGMLGYWTKDGLSSDKWANPSPVPPLCAAQPASADPAALVDALQQCVDVLADIMLDGAGRIVGLRRYSLARIALAAARAALAAQAPAREPTPEESDRG